MRHFAIAAVAATAAATNYMDFDILVDDNDEAMYLSTKSWSSAEVVGMNSVTFDGNNSLFLRDAKNTSQESVFQPLMRGGSMEYDVNVSGQESGCVTGVYLVKMDGGNCGEADQNGAYPQCKSIDSLQANIYGLSTQVNPCANGTCDAVSQCIAGMQNQGREWYGADAYGPGGTMIDTFSDFHVKTEFVATLDYEKFWKMRTTLTQGDMEVILETECPGYIEPLSDGIEGNMGIIFSNWNNNKGIEDFELDSGQSPVDSCANASSTISNFHIYTYGSIESQDAPEPEPERELVIGGVALNVDDCGMEDCAACNISWYSDDEVDTFNTCTDFTHYKYLNICSTRQNSDLCGEDDICFKSYPIADSKRWRSDDFACRPLPDRLEEGPFTYAKRRTNMAKGLCGLGCDGNAKCYNSWPVGDALKWKSGDAMPRCKE